MWAIIYHSYEDKDIVLLITYHKLSLQVDIQ